jgi:two-component system phosphate regulon sensor histidine kinase PhoR
MIEHPVESALSFATDLIHAIPECVCIYLASPDIIIPNRLWISEAGEMHRLSDLSRMGIDTSALSARLESLGAEAARLEVEVASDSLGIRRLQIIGIPGQKDVYVLYLRDETEVRRVEQMRKDFIANVSHELRTPLTAVKGYIETLLDPKYLTLERAKEFLPVIFEHTERLHNLMLDLLSLSRLESPNTHIEIVPLVLGDHLLDAVEATSPLARMKNLNVHLESPGGNMKILASPEHMERILVNLLDNAIKYSEPDGQVWIWTKQVGSFIWTHVKDEGPGIPTEELGRVFERFYRTRSALSGRARGSGLGLAIVKHIVHQLGGEMAVSSELGRGSDFSFGLRMAGE